MVSIEEETLGEAAKTGARTGEKERTRMKTIMRSGGV